jgi:hypothetical protein
LVFGVFGPGGARCFFIEAPGEGSGLRIFAMHQAAAMLNAEFIPIKAAIFFALSSTAFQIFNRSSPSFQFPCGRFIQ